ncbi:MAG: hypothetical protein Q9202_001911 [Teloschistes flavicans]
MLVQVDTASFFWTFISLSFLSYAYSIACLRLLGYKAPLVGLKSVLEPRIIGNFRFFQNAAVVINEGYDKFKTTAFKLVRNDADIVVLPAKYVEELRTIPNSIANPTMAHAHNLLGRHTDMNIILTSDLHFRMIQSKVTPNLGSLSEPMQEELMFAIENDFPACDDWVPIRPYHLVLHLVSRISARVFVGLPLCRSPKWLETSTQFTENVFVTVVFLRLFPTWLHGFLSLLLPSTWRGSAYIRSAKKLLIPEIKRRRALWQSTPPQNPEKVDLLTENLLSWMMQSAEGPETDPAHLAHLEIVISLASIHTSQMNVVHVLYDLASHPEYVEPLRGEIRDTSNEDGGWQKSSFSKLRKLDSFIKESQRFNPPSMLSYHRVMAQDHTLRDGTVLSKGTHLAMAVSAIQNDPAVTPSPELFDGLRYYKMRQQPGEGHLHQFATTEPTMLNFGHGKNACPGRFFASLEIKTILVKLIMDYDFKFVNGMGRPANLKAHEFIFPNPEGQMMVRKRSDKETFRF